MSLRPGSSSGRAGGRPIGTAAGRPPGTATRLTTGMAPGTGAQRQAMMGQGVALTAQVNVSDRPMTQQGLGGMKTGASRGPQRQVQDKTYFLGLLRSKIAELQMEIANLQHEVSTSTEDQSSFVTYDKRAEALANEIKKYQAEMGDYNTLVDKITTDESISDIQMEYEDFKSMNDKATGTLDALFEQKQQREEVIKQLDLELQQERSMTDTLIADMNPKMRQKYLELKDLNEHLLKQLEIGQQELDKLNMKKRELEEELAMSPVKQEAVRLYEQYHELEEKRDSLVDEQKARGSPQEERETLLKQVKEDNQEIASMERQTNEIREKHNSASDELQQLNMDIEENQGERNQKYKELKKREETMNEFLNNFDETKSQEIERIGQLEQNVVLIMEHMSRNLTRFGTQLPSQSELTGMKDDLNFKETEMKKSQNTASGLASESEKLHQDLAKVEQLEAKITQELDTLREKIDRMTEELEIYNDLDKLREGGELKKQQLGDNKVILYKRKEVFKKLLAKMTSEYEAMKAQLNDNETYAQLGNLERKWQHHEQNNFVMKEFIAAKGSECDYKPIAKRVNGMLSEFNAMLQSMSGKPSY